MVRGRTGLSALALLVSLFIPSVALAQGWSPAAPLPVARGALGAAAVGDTIYAVGGHEPAFPFPGWRNEALNTVTGVWTAKAPLPEARSGAAVVAVGGKVYAFGGHDGSNLHKRVEAYDPTADTWSTVTMWEAPRVGHTAAVLDGKVYLIGGQDFSGPTGQNFITAVDVYDPATDSWGSAAPIPAFRVGAAAAVLDGLIYVVGGIDLTPANKPRVISYEKATNAWTTRSAEFPEKRWLLAAGVLDGALYAAGGNDEGVAAYTFFTRYDPVADSWIEMPAMSHGRESHAVAVVGSALYAIGGIQPVVGFLASVEVFTHPEVTDAVAPQTSAARSPAPNAAGWNKGNVTVTLTATDNEGGSGVKSISYQVAGPGGTSGATVNGASAEFVVSAEGTSTITYRATDNAGNVAADKTLVVRLDKTAPGATLSLKPSVLWPPNLRMVTITPSLNTSDASGPVTLSGIAVTSNEPASRLGDWRVKNGTVQLRAWRNPHGSGRIYTVTYTVTDVAGNSTNVSDTVTVPLHRRRHDHHDHRHHHGHHDHDD